MDAILKDGYVEPVAVAATDRLILDGSDIRVGGDRDRITQDAYPCA